MTLINEEHWYKLALFIATMAHKGQFRHDGKTAYITHPLMVSIMMVENRLKPIALLHDVIEDTDITLEDLRQLDFPAYIIDAVDTLTKQQGEYYMAYLTRVKDNPDAVTVKRADIQHNMNDTLTEKQKTKYVKALEFLKSRSIIKAKDFEGIKTDKEYWNKWLSTIERT